MLKQSKSRRQLILFYVEVDELMVVDNGDDRGRDWILSTVPGTFRTFYLKI